MRGPHVHNPIRDPTANVTYDVLAYRQLTPQEVLQSVAYYHAQRRRKRRKPDRDCTVQIITIHGASPNL